MRAIRTLALATTIAITGSHAVSKDLVQKVPFSPKSGTAAKMTFTAIPETESGLKVSNPYDDPRMWGDLYTEFQAGEIGTGIAIGDLDGDGLPDIYVVNKTKPNQVFRQVSPFKFEDVSASAGAPGGPTWKTGATLADVNNDGSLDIYVCQFNGPNLLYLNDGKGHFKEAGHAAGVDLVSASVVGAFEDYDRDGKLDLFVVTNLLDAKGRSEGEVCHLFHNRGNGTFEDVSEKSGISRAGARGHSGTWFDYNGDGWPDLYVSNDYNQADHLYRNNGDGTFTDSLAEAIPHTPWFAMGADFGDINNDGQFDFFVADMAGTTHFKSKTTMGDMGGTVNDMDALVTPQYMKNSVFLNSGTDRFLEVAKMTGLGSSDWTWSPRFEDLDNDGWVDLHITNGMVRSFIDSDLLNQAKKLTSQAEVIALMKASPPLKETHLALQNDHNLRFKKVQKDWGLDHQSVGFGSAFADLDNDGDMDLVYVNCDDTVSLYRNDCPAGNAIEFELRGTQSNDRGVGARLFATTKQGLQSRELTVARGSLSSSQLIAHFGLGDETTVSSVDIKWPSGVVQHLENLAAGARYVVTEPSEKVALPAAVKTRTPTKGLYVDAAKEHGLDYVNHEKIFDDTRRQSLLPNRMNTLGEGIAVADVNGDGAPDLFFAGAAGNASALYINDGKGHFSKSSITQPWDVASDVEGMAPVFVDVNRDGALDLYVSSGSVESDKGSDNLKARLYLNDGKGKFTAAPVGSYAAPSVSAATVVAGDFDHDGYLDLFVGGRVVPGEYPTSPESLLLANRDGKLVDVTEQVCPALRHAGMVTSALWTDVDGDGWSDLLIVGEWMTPRLFHNAQGKTLDEVTEQVGFKGVSGEWNSLAAADLNGDGVPDFVVGNLGLNTKYHANKERPNSVYYADIEGKGSPQIIEAEFEGDKLFPVRGRSCSSRAMPSLKEKFPTFHAFGGALLPEIYAPEKLKNSLYLEATELSSGVFLSDGKGSYKFSALPRFAQISPLFGLAILDADGDGNLDIVGVQNFSGPQVETGHFDGGIGVLLRGDGKGGFTPVIAQESGISLPGDSRAVAVLDVNDDGWPDLAITRMDKPVALLTHRSAGSGHSLALHLKGAAGNVQAAGAKVVVHFASGRTQTTEVYSGSGYLSQSDAVVFVGFSDKDKPVSVDLLWPTGKRETKSLDASKPVARFAL